MIRNKDIVQELIASSDKRIDENFSNRLEEKISNRLSTNYLNYFLNQMFNKNIFVIILSVLLLGIVTFSLINANTNKTVKYNLIETKLDKSQGDASQSMKIAVDDHDSIDKAKEVLSFNPLLPVNVLNTKLSTIQTGRTFDGAKSDLLLIGFAENNDEILKISLMKYNNSEFIKPEGSEEVQLKVEGNKLTGYYTKYEANDIDPNSELALGGSIQSANSSLLLFVNETSIDISSYSENITKEELISVANSLIDN